MLIDATHPEETRVVVLDGTRLDEFDVESSTKKQIKGNIYLAKVVRVEPSLQAAFVEYGGNRHGFLAFSEIHPDYYQIPVADRERLLADAERHEADHHHDEQRAHADEHGHDDHGHDDHGHDHSHHDHDHGDAGSQNQPQTDHASENHAAASENGDSIPLAFIPPAISAPVASEENEDDVLDSPVLGTVEDAPEPVPAPTFDASLETGIPTDSSEPSPSFDAALELGVQQPSTDAPASDASAEGGQPVATGEIVEAPVKPAGVETVGGEDPDDDEDEDEQAQDKQRRRFVASRHYKIQEVIKRRQILLVQVVKEERGNKGAALTTYLSLAGRYCVLMPNSARGGGVSRKITSAQDRRRLKEIVGDLELPKNMAVILRTAGAERSKPEIKRDYEYLQRTWNNIREVTMQSRAPALVHEEASLIKRSIRDIYSRDIEEVWVDGEEGYKAAKDFMRVLTPSHARRVQRYRDEHIPLFQRYQVESQIETINNPSVQLRSGGSIVFGQTEALVAIDVNSGRATRERHIEETAYKTNLEAADEIARQLRLRDLAGLVVIDFIDMEDSRNNHAVERRLKEALRNDRARIQVGRISHFGLLELSRQRLRPSLIETNFKVCNHCGGTGLLRSTESAAIHTLRMIEEEGAKRRSSEVTVHVNPDVALYLLNYKREALADIENRCRMKIFVFADATLIAPNLRIDRVKRTDDFDALPAPRREIEPPPVEEEEDEPEIEEEEEAEASEGRERPQSERSDRQGHDRHGGEDGDGKRRRKRRRRRRGGEGREEGGHQPHQSHAPQQQVESQPASFGDTAEAAHVDDADDGTEQAGHEHGGQEGGEAGRDEQGRRGRRRGRRGGRRRRRGGEGGQGFAGAPGEGANGEDTAPGAIADAIESPFPADRTHAAAAETHVDETYAPAITNDVANEDGGNGNGGRRGFFRALKESVLGGGRRNEAEVEPPRQAEPPRPEPVRPEPVRAEPVHHEPVRQEPVQQAAPTYTPPPAPEPVAPEPEPTGPPRRGWWNQPGKAE
jgi:ribonuclease E